MSLNNASLFTGATVAPTGGSALPFGSLGQSLTTNKLYCTSDTDIRTRREINCSTSAPRVQSGAPNGYTQARATAVLKSPLSLDNGNVTVNTISITMAVDIETTDAEKDELMSVAAQLLCDSDFSEFFKALSLT